MKPKNEELRELLVKLHYENNELKRSICPNPFERPIDSSKLKELVWKLDREVWAKVESKEATTSWGREQTEILICQYFGDSINEISGLRKTIEEQRQKLSKSGRELTRLRELLGRSKAALEMTGIKWPPIPELLTDIDNELNPKP